MAIHEIRLELNDIRDLFRPSTANDPFLPNYRALPGIEQIALYMKGGNRRDQVKVTITLTQKPDASDDGQERLRDALARYCDARTEENMAEMHFRRQKGWRDFQRGLTIAIIFLALAAAISTQSFLPKSVGDFLSTTFTIFGSVALWHPAESLLFDWYPYLHQARIYRTLKSLPFDIQLKS